MHLVIENLERANHFAIIFQHIKNFSDYVNLSLSQEKLYVQSMDSSKISVFEVTLKPTFFSKYDYEANETIGVHVQILQKILNIKDKKQKIELIVDEGDKLNVNFTSDDVSIVNKSFQIPLIDIDEELFAIPNSEPTVSFTLDSLKFAEMVSDLKLFDDTLDIILNPTNVLLKSESTEQGSITMELNKDNMKSYEFNGEEEMNASFTLKLLYYIAVYNKVSSEVKIDISDGVPLKITYKLDEEDSQLNFHLAPKIND